MFTVRKKRWRDDLWTYEECKILRREYRAKPANYDELAKLLPGRTAKAIRTRAALMGLVPRRPAAVRDPIESFSVPSHLLDDRDRRANAPRTITQLLMGDPVR